ncbi:ATP-grasp domain-containing protein [Tundrisphaera sp. TA3]|uniref:ATP-grasp domain-containing protein n=1 Tax=Tundrisphaera sp. TA3 TaxID=3435775 RepID=UPI003EB985A0
MAEAGSGGEGRVISILVHEFATGGGLAEPDPPASWIAEGSAMRRAIVADFAAVPGVRVVSTLDARLPGEPDLPGEVVRVRADREERTIRELAARCDYSLMIAVETGGELSRLARWLEEGGRPSLGSSPGAIDRAGDKAALGTHLAALGIPTPPSRVVVPGRPWDCPWGGPIVAKPVDGAGSIDTFVIPDPRRWPAPALAMERALVQPYLPGDPMSASFLVDAAGRATPLAAGRQRIAVEGGRVEYRGGCLPVACGEADLRTVARAVDAVPGLRGLVGVDFLRDGEAGGVTILEINPRPTTSYVGLSRIHAPGTIAAAWLAACSGPLDGTPWPDRLRRVGQGPCFRFAPDGTLVSEESPP